MIQPSVYATASNPKEVSSVAMLCIHSSPFGDLGRHDTGGMSVYIRELSKELGCKGISVDVFTLGENYSTCKIIPMYKNVRLIFLNVNKDHPVKKELLYDCLPEVLGGFIEMMKKEAFTYDIIHSHYWLSGILGNQIKQLLDAAHVMSFHTLGAAKNYACSYELESDFRIKHEQELANTCDRIIVSTQNGSNELISFYQTKAEKIGIVPAGVDLELFRPINKTAARKKLGLGNKKQVLLYVGRNVPIKGLERLLKVMPDINQGNRFSLIIVGGDDENEMTGAVIKKLNIQKSVTMLGRKDHELLPMYYSASDMLVIPSYHESFGLVGLESLACGTPVVSTPVGIMPKIINDKNGCIIPEKNADTMTEVIMHVANKQRQGSYNTKQIRASVRGYSWMNTAKKMVQEYEQSLK